jgi:hypothetical protein
MLTPFPRQRRIFLVWLALEAVARATFISGLINVDFTPSGSSAEYSGAAVIGAAGDFWNITRTFSLTPIGLRYSDGSLSSVAIRLPLNELILPSGTIIRYGEGSFYGGSHPMSLGPYGALMGDGFGGTLSGQPAVFTISGLTAGADYELFAYSYYGGLGRSLIAAGGDSATVINVEGLDQLVEGQSYARLPSATADSSGNLAISLSNISGAPRALNGFQIRPVIPEPSTAGFGVLLVLSCFFDRRRTGR